MTVAIIAAMSVEAELIKNAMEEKTEERVGSQVFTKGKIGGVTVVAAVCGIGKVWAAICAEAMILRFSPDLIINTGIAGTLTGSLSIGDVAIASSVCHHDFDTTALGDAPGDAAVPGADGAMIPADRKTAERLCAITREEGVRALTGPIASGDQFISSSEKKEWIAKTFSAVACEMEGASIGHVSAANGVPFAVIRAISDSADGEAPDNYPEFSRASAERSARIVIRFIKEL
ncbi:MAG: 5'-methylthioadenosine/adenosylhomocysteine nucleosidase [Clostridia bacterium]|nr:5'-methylthioadenosine/adenosylhomocysteine nucleosidase [Clostridia bacterium]